MKFIEHMFPDSIDAIGIRCFKWCGITEQNLKKVNVIYDNVFDSCKQLIKVHIDNVGRISYDIFNEWRAIIQFVVCSISEPNRIDDSVKYQRRQIFSYWNMDQGFYQSYTKSVSPHIATVIFDLSRNLSIILFVTQSMIILCLDIF